MPPTKIPQPAGALPYFRPEALTFLRSLARNIGQHQPQSFAALGDKVVVVMMRSRVHDSILFIGKDRFKDAVEQWKAKMKAFESG